VHARPMISASPAPLRACLSSVPGCEHGPLPNPRPDSNSACLGLAAHALDRAVRHPLAHPLALSLSPFLNGSAPRRCGSSHCLKPPTPRAPLSQRHHSLNGSTLSTAPLSQRLHSLNGTTLSTAPLSQRLHSLNGSTLSTAPLSQRLHSLNGSTLSTAPLSQRLHSLNGSCTLSLTQDRSVHTRTVVVVAVVCIPKPGMCMISLCRSVVVIALDLAISHAAQIL
jgi:hypothetical protein